MIVLDASVIIAVFSSQDPHHSTAVRLLEHNAGAGFRVHPMTLAETLVAAARLGRINNAYRQIRTMGIDVFTPDVDEPLLIAELRANTGLKLPDCCVLAAALNLSEPLITFDDRLRSAAREQSIVVIDGVDEVPESSLRWEP